MLILRCAVIAFTPPVLGRKLQVSEGGFEGLISRTSHSFSLLQFVLIL